MKIGTKEFKSRLLLGSSQYPSPQVLQDAISASETEIVTLSLRRQNPNIKNNEFWEILKSLNLNLLPNTAGCRKAKEAIAIAHMAREIFGTNWIKLEITGDDYTLQSDPFELIEATRVLIEEDFLVFPYTSEDLVVAEKLASLGCEIIMPWASPIGSAQGLRNINALKTLRERLPELSLIVDAGIGKASDAARAMELGYDAILLNTAVALAHKPVQMAKAFALAIEAGRSAYEAGLIEEREMALASTPIVGTPFWK